MGKRFGYSAGGNLNTTNREGKAWLRNMSTAGVKIMRTLVPPNQVPQLKVGESIPFDSHQSQMIHPIYHPTPAPFTLGVWISLFIFGG